MMISRSPYQGTQIKHNTITLPVNKVIPYALHCYIIFQFWIQNKIFCSHTKLMGMCKV
jgi:hypothetical protein